MNPGNSGGPLLGDDAAVVGVISFGLDEAQNLNYGVAADEVRSFLEAFDKKFSAPSPKPSFPAPPPFTVSPLPGGGQVRKSETAATPRTRSSDPTAQ